MVFTKTNIFVWSSIIQLGANVAILSILSLHMYDDDGMCLLSKDGDTVPCDYGYVASGIGCGLCVGVSLLSSCNKDVLTRVIALWLCIASAWYSCWGGIVTWYAHSANQALVPQQDWRIAIVSLVWMNLGVTFLTTLFHDWNTTSKVNAYQSSV